MRIYRTRMALIGACALGAAISAAALAPLIRYAHTTHPKSGQPIVVPGKDGAGTLLFNGWRITPAGRAMPSGDMRLGDSISPDGKTLASAKGGFADPKLHLIDLATEKEIASLPIKRTWIGVAWSPAG